MDYYRDYFSRLNDLSPAGRRKTWFDLERQYRHYLPTHQDSRILDFGCGAGRMLEWLRDACGYTCLGGVDVSPGQVAFARSIGLDVAESPDPVAWLRAQPPYDIIFIIDVLEHLPEETVAATLQAAHVSLKQNGSLVIRVPNASAAFATRYRYHDPTHMRLYTELSLRTHLIATGYDEIRVLGDDVWAVRSVSGAVRLAMRSISRLSQRFAAIGEFGPEGFHIPLSLNLIAAARRPAITPNS